MMIVRGADAVAVGVKAAGDSSGRDCKECKENKERKMCFAHCQKREKKKKKEKRVKRYGKKTISQNKSCQSVIHSGKKGMQLRFP